MFQVVAKELAGAFEAGTRNDGATYWALPDDAPAWTKAHGDDYVTPMLRVHKALDDRGPDDWVYENAAHIADAIAEHETADEAREAVHELADDLVDVYNADRARWLASNLNNAALVDEAVEEYGYDKERGIFGAIGQGQYLAIERIASALIDLIETEAEAREEAAA